MTADTDREFAERLLAQREPPDEPAPATTPRSEDDVTERHTKQLLENTKGPTT